MASLETVEELNEGMENASLMNGTMRAWAKLIPNGTTGASRFAPRSTSKFCSASAKLATWQFIIGRDPKLKRRSFSSNYKLMGTLQHDPMKRTIFTSRVREWHRPDFMRDASVEAKQIWLESLEERNEVDVAAYLVVLKALAQSRQGGSPQRAEELILRLEHSHDLQPTVECYNAVISAWANGSEDASLLSVVRAERWFNQLQKNAKEGTQPTPNTESYNAFLDACSRGHAKRRTPEKAREHAQKAQETLEEMIAQQEQLGPGSPIIANTESFNYVIRAWTRCRDEPPVADHVMDIVKQMASYQRKDPENSPVLPNTRSYTMAMDAFGAAAALNVKRCEKSRHPSEDWLDPSKNGLKEVEMVEELLQYMHSLHEAGINYIVPNTVTYNILISSWARLSGPVHPDGPLSAEKALRKMLTLKEEGHPEVAPDALSFTKVILAWTNLGKDNAGKRAEFWLKKLHEHYEMENDERLKPDTAVYNAVIKAWFRLGHAENAEKLLIQLIHHEERQDVPFLKPNTESFSMVIHAWLKANQNASGDLVHSHGVKLAAKWLEELIRREDAGTFSVTSSPELFDGVLKYASKCTDITPDLLELSIEIYEKYQASRHRVNFMAYVWLLKTGLHVFGTPEYGQEARFSFIRRLVKDCCDGGFLSNVFVRELANGQVHYDGWTRSESEIISNEFFSSWPLPPEWSRNLQHDFYIPEREDTMRTNREVKLRNGAKQDAIREKDRDANMRNRTKRVQNVKRHDTKVTTTTSSE